MRAALNCVISVPRWPAAMLAVVELRPSSTSCSGALPSDC